MPEFRPVDARVVCVQEKPEEKTKGGIVLPDVARDDGSRSRTTWHKMKVVAVGPGRLLPDGRRAPMQCKVGDTVMADRYAGPGIKIDGVLYRFLDEAKEEVMAVLEA